MRKFILVVLSTTMALLFFVGFSWVVVPPGWASVPVGDKLSFYGDFRFRYEIDSQKRTSPNVNRDRDRARIRARFGFKHKSTDNVEFGMRLRSESDTGTKANAGKQSQQSPHQTLGILGSGGNEGRSEDFGLDRAYVNIKFLKGGFVWFGKHAPTFWEQTEGFWDGDIQPEGVGYGYKLKLGETGSLTVQGFHTYLNENSWTSDAFGDDTGTLFQGLYTRTMGDHTITVATAAFFVADRAADDVPGGSATYTTHGIQLKTKAIPDIPIKVGFDFLVSSADDKNIRAIDATDTTQVDKANVGYIILIGAKYKKWSFKIEHYRIELNSVPAQGLLAQDDLPHSSNFVGQKFQIGYNFGNGLQADFRLMPQHIINKDVSNPTGGDSVMATGEEDRIRYQINFNAKF